MINTTNKKIEASVVHVAEAPQAFTAQQTNMRSSFLHRMHESGITIWDNAMAA
jgi:hypothetical protein